MAHKNLVGGTAYDTKGGRCLVDGTAYSVKKGRTLVGGTGYNVSFSKMCTVTITKSGARSGMAYVEIDDTQYSTATTLEVPSGTVMRCTVKGSDTVSGSSYAEAFVKVNGTTVVSGTRTHTYDYTINGDIGVALYGQNIACYGSVTITEL